MNKKYLDILYEHRSYINEGIKTLESAKDFSSNDCGFEVNEAKLTELKDMQTRINLLISEYLTLHG